MKAEPLVRGGTLTDLVNNKGDQVRPLLIFGLLRKIVPPGSRCILHKEINWNIQNTSTSNNKPYLMSKTVKVRNLALNCKQMYFIAFFTGIRQEIVCYLIGKNSRII